MVTIPASLGSYISTIDIEFIYRRKQAMTGFFKGTKGRTSNKLIKKTTLKDRNSGNNIII
jgi:hypothetical protein